MSADNGVYVLRTVRTMRRNGLCWERCKPYYVWRIAYTSAIDNFDYIKEHTPYNLGAYMRDIWGESKIYENELCAGMAALQLAKTIDYLEYGVSYIETDFVFYGDL